MTTMDRATVVFEGMSNPLLTAAPGAYAAELGQAVEQACAARRDHVAAFPEGAARCLREVGVPEGLDAPTILRSVAIAPNLVRQMCRVPVVRKP